MLSFLHRRVAPGDRRMPAGSPPPDARRAGRPLLVGAGPYAARSVARVTEAGGRPARDRLETPGRLARRGLRSPSDDRPPTRATGVNRGVHPTRAAPGASSPGAPPSPLAVEWMGHDGSVSPSHGYTRRCIREPGHLSCAMSSNAIRNRTEALDPRSKNHSTRRPDRVPFRQTGVLHHPVRGREGGQARFPRGLTDICTPHVVTYPPMNPRLRDFPRHAM
jgi:hypothetical protein